MNASRYYKIFFTSLLITILIVGSSPALTAAAAPLLAEHSVSVSPNQGVAGRTVTVFGSGYAPGTGSILWDGSPRDTVNIKNDRTFSKSFIIPPGASVGPHTIAVCWGSPCETGEFEQKANTSYTVLPPPTNTPLPFLPPFSPLPLVPSPTPVGEFDVKVFALEVTQGVRGDIPMGASAGRPMILPGDGAVHVANRRTVVRVYPAAQVENGGRVPPVTARLQGFTLGGSQLPGSPLSPVTVSLIPEPGRSLDTMRRNAAFSWNFILPNSWVQAGTIRLLTTVNPPGAEYQLECEGCEDNNQAELRRVEFTTVQTQNIDVRLYIADLYYRDDAGQVVNFQPTPSEIVDAINYWMKVWPMDPSKLRLSFRYISLSQNPPGFALDAAGNSIREVDPPIPGAPQWDNQVIKDENADIIFPEGTIRPYAYIPLLFSSSSWMGCDGKAGTNGPPLFHAGACGATLAQEAAHSISRTHAGASHGEDDGIDAGYPGTHGQVESFSYGFDTWAMQAIPPTSSDSGHSHDFMSYGGNSWVSIYTWEAIADLFDSEEVEVGFEGVQLVSNSLAGSKLLDGREDFLRISGDIDLDGNVFLDTAYTVRLPIGATDITSEGSYRIELFDQDGESLFSRQFEATHTAYYDAWQFYQLVPVVEGLAQIILSQDGVVLASIPVSTNPPQVSLLSPADGDSWAASGETIISWEGSDPDGDPVNYRVEASPDGESWEILAGPTDQNQAIVKLANVPGWGAGWRVRVQASDGINVASDEVGNISIAAKPPQPFILFPLDGAFVQSGQAISVMGQASDYEDGAIPEAALEWLVDGEVVTSGENATLAGLSTGEHTLGLRATNSEGLTSLIEIRISAGIDTDNDKIPDDWENEFGLDPSDPNDAAQDPDEDALLNWQEFIYGTDPNNPDSDEDSFSDQLEIDSGSDPLDPDSTPFFFEAVNASPPRGKQMEKVKEAVAITQSERLILIAGILAVGLTVGIGLIVRGMRM